MGNSPNVGSSGTKSKHKADRVMQLCTKDIVVIETMPLLNSRDNKLFDPINIYNPLYKLGNKGDFYCIPHNLPPKIQSIFNLYERYKRANNNHLHFYIQINGIAAILKDYLAKHTETLNKAEIVFRKEMVMVCDWMHAMHEKYADEIADWHFVYKWAFYECNFFDYYYDSTYKSIVEVIKKPPLPTPVKVLEPVPEPKKTPIPAKLGPVIVPAPKKTKQKESLEIESPFVDIFAEPLAAKETDWLLFKEKIM
jgi:hypothetical protein